jgi:BA14K-like protein
VEPSVENDMRSKLLTSVAALGLTACTVLATAAPASAAPWGWHRGWHGGGWGWPAAVAAGVVGGAVAAATSPLWAPGYYDYGPGPGYAYGPGYGYGYGPAPAPGPYVEGGPAIAQNSDVSYCASRFRSYDPRSGTYLGFDGVRHPCP